MSVGVEAIDVHHRQIWRRIRHLANAVSDGRSGEVRASLRFLQGYLAEHFSEEERWMAEAGYPGAREHARMHAEILERVRADRDDAGAGTAKRLLAAAEWVARSLEAHMRTDDLRLGRFWTARENLRVLAERGPGVGAALTPIPGSLRTATPRPQPPPGAARAPEDPERT